MHPCKWTLWGTTLLLGWTADDDDDARVISYRRPMISFKDDASFMNYSWGLETYYELSSSSASSLPWLCVSRLFLYQSVMSAFVIEYLYCFVYCFAYPTVVVSYSHASAICMHNYRKPGHDLWNHGSYNFRRLSISNNNLVLASVLHRIIPFLVILFWLSQPPGILNGPLTQLPYLELRPTWLSYSRRSYRITVLLGVIISDTYTLKRETCVRQIYFSLIRRKHRLHLL